MSGYGSNPYYGPMQMPLQQASWDANAMVNPYTGLEDARYINTHPSVVAGAGAVPVPVEPQLQVGRMPQSFSKDNSLSDVLKVGVGIAALAGLWTLLTHKSLQSKSTGWEGLWKWLKNPLAKRFPDDQRILTAKWMEGLHGKGARAKQANLSKRMTAEGGTGFVQQAINYLSDDYGKTAFHRIRNAHALDAKREQALDVMLLHRELLRDPADKLFKQDFYKAYGFKTHAEAVHQTQSVLRALIENYRRSGPRHNEKVQTITNISENFLDMYIQRHKVDPTNYPMGEGTALLSRLVHLPKIQYLIQKGWFGKAGRELEAERGLRQFLYIASNQTHDYSGKTATNPVRLFKADEWKLFIQQYRKIMEHKLPKNAENRKLLAALNDLAEQGSKALNQQGTDPGQVRVQDRLEEALTELIRQTRNPGPPFQQADILKEIQGQQSNKEGDTFALLQALLLEHHPQMDHLHTMA
ncbi:MAG: hypothetical protein ACK551_00455 [Vampirovibrionales bacterium]